MLSLLLQLGHLVLEKVLYGPVLPAMLNLLALLLNAISPRVVVDHPSPEPIMLSVLNQAQMTWLFDSDRLLGKVNILDMMLVVHAVGNCTPEVRQVNILLL